MSKRYQDLTSADKNLVQITFKNPKSLVKSKKGLGCDFCPQDTNPLTRKIKGLKRIKGKKIFIWTQNPGGRETIEGLELVGPAGQWLWKELKAVAGIDRSECDVQNVVRCECLRKDIDTGDIISDTPGKEEIKCCSIYNKRAIELNAGKAKLHLVFGQVAAKSLLGREYKKDTPIFWSQILNAKVVLLDHPSYFLHGAPKHRLDQFRDRLRLAVGSLKHSGKFGYIAKQNYGLLKKPSEVKKYLIYIAKYCSRNKKAVTLDIETGWLYKDWNSERLRSNEVCADTPGVRRAVLLVGFCHAPGAARAIVVDHPDVYISPKNKKRIKSLLKIFIESPLIEKVMHHGSSDDLGLQQDLDTKVKNYWFDTNYTSYLCWPQLKKYGLDGLTKEKIPEFAGYKDMIKDYLIPGKANFATIPLKLIGTYNCTDCDVEKRLEIITRKELMSRGPKQKPLIKTYKNVAYTLQEMQERGPYFDERYARRFSKAISLRLKTKLKILRRLSGQKNLNPRSHPQIKKVLYEIFKLPIITVNKKEGRTDEATCQVLYKKYKIKFLKHLLDYRGWRVMKHTQLKGYFRSAKANKQRLKTIYWLTGAITGRLRSGGRKDDPSVVNLQNIPKDPTIKDMLISDPMWRMIEKWFEKKEYEKILKRKVYLVADYSAIELRVIAEIAEPKFVKIFKSGKDIHGKMGSGFTDWTYKQICEDEEIRTKVKNIDFGIPYGKGKQGLYEMLLARGTKISRAESDKLWDNYFAEYDGVLRLQEESKQFALDNNYVETLFGFRRPVLTGDYADEETRGSYFANQAINSIVQGTAHQYLLFAMALLHTHKNTFNRLNECSMEIHDALAFFSYVKRMQEAYKQLKNLLEVAVPAYVEKHFKYKLKVPLVCEIKAGFRLGVMVKYHGEDPMEFIGNWLEKNKEVSAIVRKEWGVSA